MVLSGRLIINIMVHGSRKALTGQGLGTLSFGRLPRAADNKLVQDHFGVALANLVDRVYIHGVY